MSPPLFRWPLAIGALLLPASQGIAAQTQTWALTNARIETVTRGTIEKGTIILRRGLIEAVGAGIPIPPDARVLDLSGRTVSPGMIDLASTIAPVPPRAGAARPAGFGAAPEPTLSGRPAGFEPSLQVTDELAPAAADLKAAREAGITAVLIAPTRGGIKGRSALIPTRDELARGAVISAPVAMHFGFQPTQGGYPGTLLGVIAYQRQILYDAGRYGALVKRYESNPVGMERPAFDPDLDALVPAATAAMPSFYAAATENEIRRAVRIGAEFGLKLTVVGATEGWRALDALKGHSAVVSVNYPRPPQTTGWSYRLARRDGPDSTRADSVARVAIEGNAAALHRAGVRFAIGTGGTRPADFRAGVRRAVAGGLPAAAALEAVTIRAAELAGVDRTLGSIEAGKIANLVVTERGGLLADSAQVRAVFIDGEHYDVTPPPAGNRPNARAGGAAAAQVGGTWLMTVTSPQGPMEMTVALEQTGASLAGRITSQLGSNPIDEGRVAGNSVSWSMTIQMGGQSMTIGFQGDVSGTRMTGTASLGTFGSAPFTAEKQP